jgi:hypothetical protein
MDEESGRKTTQYCRCDARMAAHAKGEFLWSYTRNSWYFPNVTRSLSRRTWYYAEGTTEDHTGEPYEYFDCPFCQRVLPGCHEDTQADGNKEVE